MNFSPALLSTALLISGPEFGSPQEPAGSGTAAASATPSLTAERALAAKVDDKRAARRVREVVQLGPRMGGTASGLRSVRYLEAAFKDMGLSTVRHLARKTWCHGETAWSVRATVEGSDPVEIARAWPRGFSPAGAGSHRLSAEASPATALLASGFRGTARGDEPPAVVLDDGRTSLDGEWPVCGSHPRGRRARTAVFGIPKPVGRELRAALEEGRDVQVDWSLETVIQEAQPITVVATLPAGDHAPAGHVLVCAHGDSDSGGPGANDNGSGVAIVLEMAHVWSAAVAAGELPPPSQEVRFAIWGKEIHSTRDYLESELGKDVTCVLNFDQAGFGSTGDRIHVEPDDLPSNVAYVRIAAGVLADHAGQPGFPKRWATNKSLGGTDSYVFSGHKRFRADGLPSVTMFTSAWGKPDEQIKTAGMPGESWSTRDRVEMDYDVHYHSAGDTPENTTDKEPDNMGWCARVGILTTLRWLAR